MSPIADNGASCSNGSPAIFSLIKLPLPDLAGSTGDTVVTTVNPVKNSPPACAVGCCRSRNVTPLNARDLQNCYHGDIYPAAQRSESGLENSHAASW